MRSPFGVLKVKTPRSTGGVLVGMCVRTSRAPPVSAACQAGPSSDELGGSPRGRPLWAQMCPAVPRPMPPPCPSPGWCCPPPHPCLAAQALALLSSVFSPTPAVAVQNLPEHMARGRVPGSCGATWCPGGWGRRVSQVSSPSMVQHWRAHGRGDRGALGACCVWDREASPLGRSHWAAGRWWLLAWRGERVTMWVAWAPI